MVNPVAQRRNPLAFFLALGLAAITLIGSLSVAFGPSEPAPASSSRLPKTPDPEADTPTEVLHNLTARVEQEAKQNKALQNRNQELRHELKTTQDSLRNFRRQFEHDQKDPKFAKEMGKVTDTLGALAGRITNLEKDGLGDLGIGGALPAAEPKDPTAIRWIEPLDIGPVAFDSKRNQALSTLLQPAAKQPSPLITPESQVLPGATVQAPGAAGQGKVLRRYTIPPDSKLINSTLWTALLGRVAVRGNVIDPFEFSILTGATNLAASGIHIPNIEGVVWSGVARGEFLTRCIRGDLYSATFIFKDGTIVTKRIENPPATGQLSAVSHSRNSSLGYLTTPSGIECLPGKLITNAAGYLGTSTLLSAAEAAAGAFAAGETTSVVGGALGTVTNTVDGNVGKFVAGEALRGGASNAQRWVEERLGQSLDVIFVPPGGRVTINVREMIEIDYDTEGRRVSYAKPAVDPYRSQGLD